MASSDENLINALRDHAENYESTTSSDNASHKRDIDQAEEARRLAWDIENGKASDEDKARAADLVHPSIRTRYGL